MGHTRGRRYTGRHEICQRVEILEYRLYRGYAHITLLCCMVMNAYHLHAFLNHSKQRKTKFCYMRTLSERRTHMKLLLIERACTELSSFCHEIGLER